MLQTPFIAVNRTQRGPESMDAIAASLRQKHGKPLFLDRGKYDGWVRESCQLATTKAYPVPLFHRAKPTAAYFALALTEAEPRLALGGYRLGEVLNAILRQEPRSMSAISRLGSMLRRCWSVVMKTPAHRPMTSKTLFALFTLS